MKHSVMGASRVAEDAVACIGTLLLAFGVLAIAPDDPPSSRPTPVWTTVGGGGGVVGGGVVGGAKRLRNGRDANNGNEDDADDDDEDIAGPSDNAGRASKAPRRTERRSATAPSPPSALDAEESQSEWERRLLAPRPLNQTPAEDFESLPKELRSRGGLELYRAMTEQHDFSDLVGAFAIAHYVGGLGQARALEAMMACIEREGLVDLPRDVAGRAEKWVCEAFGTGGSHDVTRLRQEQLFQVATKPPSTSYCSDSRVCLTFWSRSTIRSIHTTPW